MLKCLLSCFFAALLLLPASVAKAGDTNCQAFWKVRINDPDPKGANIRDAPGGKVIDNVPLTPEDEEEGNRNAFICEEKDGWFRVILEDGVRGGWMHGSILVTFSGMAEAGPCPLAEQPDNDAPPVIFPESGALMSLLSMRMVNGAPWMRVRYIGLKGIKYEGWLPQMCM